MPCGMLQLLCPQPTRLPACAVQVLRNERCSCATDLWALGCVLYQMLVGKVSCGRMLCLLRLLCVRRSQLAWQLLCTRR